MFTTTPRLNTLSGASSTTACFKAAVGARFLLNKLLTYLRQPWGFPTSSNAMALTHVQWTPSKHALLPVPPPSVRVVVSAPRHEVTLACTLKLSAFKLQQCTPMDFHTLDLALSFQVSGPLVTLLLGALDRVHPLSLSVKPHKPRAGLYH